LRPRPAATSGPALLHAARQDLAYELRGVRRAPGTTATIVLTLALGLGLMASAFTIFSAVVLRADAAHDPGSLFRFERVGAPGSGGSAKLRLNRGQFERMRREMNVFAGLAARVFDITTRIDGPLMEGQLVTGSFFDVLGVRPALGRALTPADDAGQPVLVQSDDAWRRLFGGGAVVGRTVLVRGVRFHIVGLAPAGFRGLDSFAPDFWAPLSQVGHFRGWSDAGQYERIAVDIIGRLKPDVRPAAARCSIGSRPSTQRWG
jgi:hypothetical protein